MLGKFGNKFFYQAERITIRAKSTIEVPIRTISHFKYCTGLMVVDITGTAPIVDIGIKQRNKYIINPVPYNLFWRSDGYSGSFLDNFIRFNAQAEGESITLFLNNEEPLPVSLEVILLLTNEKVTEYWQYDFDRLLLIPGSETKLNINSKCKYIDQFVFVRVSIPDYNAHFSIKDRINYHLYRTRMNSFTFVRNNKAVNRLFDVDIPVTDLFVIYEHAAVDFDCKFLYRYKEDNNVGPIDVVSKKVEKDVKR